MSGHLLQVTLYPDGRILVSGTPPRDLGCVLRTIADAADAGEITWIGSPVEE